MKISTPDCKGCAHYHVCKWTDGVTEIRRARVNDGPFSIVMDCTNFLQTSTHHSYTSFRHVFPTPEDRYQFMTQVREHVDRYGVITLADLYEAVGSDYINYYMSLYGWRGMPEQEGHSLCEVYLIGATAL